MHVGSIILVGFHAGCLVLHYERTQQTTTGQVYRRLSGHRFGEKHLLYYQVFILLFGVALVYQPTYI